MSPARDERRQAVLGLLATHGAVTRPVRVATDAQRQAAMAQIRERLNGGSGT